MLSNRVIPANVGRMMFVALYVFAAAVFATEPAAQDSLTELGRYSLAVCPNCGDPNTSMGQAFSKVYDGREVIFCCEDCAVPFEKNLQESMSALNRRIADAQRAEYPLTTCLVCGETLGSEGKYVEAVHLNRYLRFCCSECLSSFDKNPALYSGNLTPATGTPAGEQE